MFFSNGVSIKNIVWLIEAFALCTPAVNRSRYARKADEIRIHAAVPPFFPAPFGARIVIYTEENFRGPVRTAVFLFMDLWELWSKQRQQNRLARCSVIVCCFDSLFNVFPLELRMLARTYFFTAAVFSLILKHILINESKEEILLTFGLARFCR